MQYNAYSSLFLAEVRHAELQAQGARYDPTRRNHGDGTSIHDVVALWRYQLGTTVLRARDRLDAIAWIPVAIRRGAQPQ